MIGDRIDVNISGGLDVNLPRMVRVHQKFATTKVNSIAEIIAVEFAKAEVRDRIKPGMRIAVGCGSRGIANVAECTGEVIKHLKNLGAAPFIFPAMGSHGAATAEGQVEVLADLGITEEAMGCPIESSMEVVELGKLTSGMPIYFDKIAAQADAVALVCRVKPHTHFRAPIESGIIKMLAIGMGKIAGATEFHRYGMDTFKDSLPEAGELIMANKNFLFGVAMVENAADETAIVEVVPGEKVLEREPELLVKAKELMPKLQFDEIDVLVVDRIGKNISGAGMDPNIIGRSNRFTEWERKPVIHKIVALGLTRETGGNAAGASYADIITMNLYREFDPAKTYANVITATLLDGAAIPMIMNTDEEAVQLATKTLLRTSVKDAKIVHIANTLEVVAIDISENLLPYVEANPSMFEVIGEPTPIQFDGNGSMTLMPSHFL